ALIARVIVSFSVSTLSRYFAVWSGWAPLCRSFSRATHPQERREALPFSLSFIVWLERRVLHPDTSCADILLIGSLLCAVWGSLRWSDLLWCPPDRIHLHSDGSVISGIAMRAKVTRSGMPWGILPSGLTGTPSGSWSLRWLAVLKQSLQRSRAAFPNRVIDFLPALLSGPSDAPVLFSPLQRDRGVTWIRSLLMEHWRESASGPPPEAFRFIGAHSAKVTLLSWARQLNFPSDLRRIQGHHRLSGADASVALYSRDDIGAMVYLQRALAFHIRSGFRPMQPLARGLAEPLPDFPVQLPAAVPLGTEPLFPAFPGLNLSLQTPAATDPVPQPASPVVSGHSPPSSGQDTSAVRHAAVRVEAHAARSLEASDPSGSGTVWVRPACGSQTRQLAPDSLCDSVPPGTTLCLRTACLIRFSTVP
ncbi:unnamed protein product, partial [Symbiodinium sp. CCMP2456]